MSWLGRFTWLLLAVSLAFLSATVFLVSQYKQGIPYPFATSMTLAALVGIAAPLAGVIVYGFVAKGASPRARYFVFYAVCVAITAIIGISTF